MPTHSGPEIALVRFLPLLDAIITQIRRAGLVAVIRVDLIIRPALEPSHVATYVASPAVVELIGAVCGEAVDQRLLLIIGETVVLLISHALLGRPVLGSRVWDRTWGGDVIEVIVAFGQGAGSGEGGDKGGEE